MSDQKPLDILEDRTFEERLLDGDVTVGELCDLLEDEKRAHATTETAREEAMLAVGVMLKEIGAEVERHAETKAHLSRSMHGEFDAITEITRLRVDLAQAEGTAKEALQNLDDSEEEVTKLRARVRELEADLTEAQRCACPTIHQPGFDYHICAVQLLARATEVEERLAQLTQRSDRYAEEQRAQVTDAFAQLDAEQRAHSETKAALANERENHHRWVTSLEDANAKLEQVQTSWQLDRGLLETAKEALELKRKKWELAQPVLAACEAIDWSGEGEGPSRGQLEAIGQAVVDWMAARAELPQ